MGIIASLSLFIKFELLYKCKRCKHLEEDVYKSSNCWICPYKDKKITKTTLKELNDKFDAVDKKFEKETADK